MNKERRRRLLTIFAVYVVLVFAGAGLIRIRTLFEATKANRRFGPLPTGFLDESRVAWVAARHLVKNHQLTAEDLVRDPELPRATDVLLPDKSGLTGRFLIRSRKPHEVIRKSDVAGRPVIDVVPNTAVVFATIPNDLTAKLIDAGSLVDVAAAGKVVALRRRVNAIECKGGKCFALVRVTTPEAAQLVAGEMPVVVVRAAP